MKRTDQVEGFISSLSVRKTRSGSYAHDVHIGRKRYSLFRDTETCALSLGDYVRFIARRKQYLSTRKVYWAVDPDSVEVVAPAEVRECLGGFVYVLTNPSLKGLVKIGFTTGSPRDRAQQLSSSTGVPTPFELEWCIPIHGDASWVERAAHALLNERRHGKEFFRVSVQEAKEGIREAYAATYPNNGETVDEAMAERRQRVRAQRRIEEVRREQARKQVEFDRTSVGRWLKCGTVRFAFGKIDVPKHAELGWFGKIFRAPPADWLSISLKGREDHEAVLFVEGLSKGEAFRWHVNSESSELAKLLDRIKAFLTLFAPSNWEFEVELPVKLLQLTLPDACQLQDNVLTLESPEYIESAVGGSVERIDLAAFTAIYPASESTKQDVRLSYASVLKDARDPRSGLLGMRVPLPPKARAASAGRKTEAKAGPPNSIEHDYGDKKAYREMLLSAGVSPEQIDAMFDGR